MTEFIICNCNYAQEDLNSLAILKSVLPNSTAITVCQYIEDEVTFEAIIRLPLTTEEELTAWLNDYQQITKTTLRKSRTYPNVGQKLVFKCEYRCQHNTRQRNELVNSKRSSKNTHCPFQLTATVRRTDVPVNKAKRFKYATCHLSVPTAIRFKNKHNHALNSVEALRKRDVSLDVRNKFIQLYSIGHTPLSALETHKCDLQLQDPVEDSETIAIRAADRHVCPDIQWCYRLYYEMFGSKNRSLSENAAQMEVAVLPAEEEIEFQPDEQQIQCQLQEQLQPEQQVLVAVESEQQLQLQQQLSDGQHPDTIILESKPCNLEVDDIAQAVADIGRIAQTLTDKLLQDPGSFLEPVKALVQNFDGITTAGGLISAMHCFGKYSGVSPVFVPLMRKRKPTGFANKSRQSGAKLAKHSVEYYEQNISEPLEYQPTEIVPLSEHDYGKPGESNMPIIVYAVDSLPE